MVSRQRPGATRYALDRRGSREIAVYGWAAWSPKKGIIVLRNPSDHMQEFSLDVQTTFDLPLGAPKLYDTDSPWKDPSFPMTRLTAGKPRAISLLPFQVLTLAALPISQSR